MKIFNYLPPYFLVFFVITLTCQVAYSQLSNSDYDLLTKELHQKINDYRVQNGLGTLETDPILEKAALSQCEYMVKYDTLTHAQKKGSLKTPAKRVKYYKGKVFEFVGENVLNHGVESFKMNKKEISQLAEELFVQWKKSPPHNANMLGTEYTFAGLAFKEDLKTNRIFAAQVFARKGMEVEGQLSSNGFGLRKGPDNCSDQYEQISNIILNIGNSIHIEGDEIVFYFHDIALFKRIFNSPKDGLAIDLLKREQFLCSGPNQLDASKVYDGILLKPVFRNEILANNRAENPFHIISTIGKLPTDFSDFNDLFSGISTVMIKDGKACDYLISCVIFEDDYPLVPVDPKLINPTAKELSGRGVGEVEQLTYEFHSSDVQTNKQPAINRKSANILGVTIQSYSSVEGDPEKNERLHTARAAAIKADIMSRLGVPPNKIQIDSKINWELMRFQLLYAGADSLARLENDSIRALIAAGDSTLNWDSLLYVQRTSVATIYYADKSTEEISKAELAGQQLIQALAQENYAKANKCLYVLFLEEEEIDTETFFSDGVFDAIKSRPELVQNSAALLSKYAERNLHKTTEFVFSWINRKEELSDDARHNMLILYTQIGSQLLDRWDVSAQRLSNVVHPIRMKTIEPEILQYELLVNTHLVYIKYFGQINDSKGIQTSFDFITEYFKDKSLGMDDDIQLALFFNNWSVYNRTIDFLSSKYQTGEINEIGLLILATTMNLADNDHPLFIDVNKSLIDANKLRWCEWINGDYQTLRNVELKALYCEFCE